MFEHSFLKEKLFVFTLKIEIQWNISIALMNESTFFLLFLVIIVNYYLQPECLLINLFFTLLHRKLELISFSFFFFRSFIHLHWAQNFINLHPCKTDVYISIHIIYYKLICFDLFNIQTMEKKNLLASSHFSPKIFLCCCLSEEREREKKKRSSLFLTDKISHFFLIFNAIKTNGAYVIS